MKLLCLLLALGPGVVGNKAYGLSAGIEINPKWVKDFPFAFDIRSERLPSGEIQFTVKVSEKSTEFPKNYSTDLGAVKITEYWEKHTACAG